VSKEVSLRDGLREDWLVFFGSFGRMEDSRWDKVNCWDGMNDRQVGQMGVHL
jgi:hypothetical protein